MRVLGLDVSKDAISCVEIETAFGRFEVRETHELPFNPDADFSSESPILSVPDILSRVVAPHYRIVTTLPVELTTFRNLQIGSKDKKAVKAALEFELEDDLPFESDSLHYDSVILESGAQGSLIHVGATKKENFSNFLKHWEAISVDPDIITTDAWAWRSLFSRILKTAEPALLIGIEHHRTFFYVGTKNRPVLYRELPFGVKTIEQKLGEAMSGSETEVVSWIKDIGLSGIDEQVSNAISDILEVLVPELKQAELSARAIERNPIEQVYLTGEGSLMPGLAPWLESALNKRVEFFKPLSLISNAKVAYSDLTEIRCAKALALAMTLIPGDKLPALNLRKKDFAKAGHEQNSPLELIKKPLPYIITLLLVFFAVKTIEYNYYKGKLSDSEESLKKGVKSYFGGISDNSVRVRLSDTTRLKRDIEKDLAKERELSKLFTPNPNSPLDFLKTISQKVGKDVVVDMVSFESGGENTEKFVENKALKTSVTFVVKNPQLIAKLSDTLDHTFGFKKGMSEEVTEDGKPAYRVTFTGTIGGGK